MAAFRGSASTDTGRFQNKHQKMMNKINFPEELNVKIDMEKIEFTTIKQWITHKVEALTGIEDDILTGFIFNLLESETNPNPKSIYVQLVPFLERKVRKFMVDLWILLKSAQENGTGVPQSMLDELRVQAKQMKRQEKQYGDKLDKRYGEKNKKEKDTKQEKSRMDESRHDSRRGDRDRYRRRDSDLDTRRGRDNSRRRESSRKRKRLRSPSPPRIKKKRKPRQCASPSPPKALSRNYRPREDVHQSASSSESSGSSDSEDSEDDSSS